MDVTSEAQRDAIGLLFTPQMILALKDGKTVTRRKLSTEQAACDLKTRRGRREAVALCRYGQVGRWVYAKETFRVVAKAGHALAFIRYSADGAIRVATKPAREFYKDPKIKPVKDGDYLLWPTLPSIFLPRSEARILLRIARLSIEPVQLLTDADAMREGVASRAEYARLWNEINGATPGLDWASNPWCLRIEFNRKRFEGCSSPVRG
jgi:hypothetical protein